MPPSPTVVTTAAGAVHSPSKPNVLHALQQMAKVVGPAQALEQWSQAAAVTGHHGMHLEPNEIKAVADELLKADGVTRIIAMSLSARCSTYEILNRGKEAEQ